MHNFLRQTGPAMSPFNAWVHAEGPGDAAAARARSRRRTRRASPIFSAGQKGIARVLYPGRADHPQAELGTTADDAAAATLVTFDVDGGKAAAFRFLNALRDDQASPTISATPRA